MWNLKVSRHFLNGMIHGYFSDCVPDCFFLSLRVLAFEALLSHLPWALSFGANEEKIALENLKIVLDTYQNFDLVIPSWYEIPMSYQ